VVEPVPVAELIETTRLLLRPVGPELATAILAQPEAAVVAGRGWPHPDTLAALAAAARPGAEPTWLVVERDSDTVIGECGWKGAPDDTGTVEIGYGLAGPSRGRGYGTELIGALVAWSFAGNRCKRLVAEVRRDNVASRRALERNGFVLDRVAPPYLWLSRTAQI
jgi:[ribosomal protein S5]-alanine N-acetyltransferase